MSRNKLNELQGTPTHLETLHKDADDSRRDKRTCRYYIKKVGKSSGRCGYYSMRCPGSAHCAVYRRWTEEELEAAKKIKRKSPDKIIVDNNFDKSVVGKAASKHLIGKPVRLKPAIIPDIPPNPFARTTNDSKQAIKPLKSSSFIKTPTSSEKSKTVNSSITRVTYGRLEYLGKSYIKGSVVYNKASEKGFIEYFYKSEKGRVCVQIRYNKRVQDYRWKTFCLECGLKENGIPEIVETSKI